MKQIIRCQVLLVGLISVLHLTGCATPGKGTLPQGGEMTMADIYKQETGLSMNNTTNTEDSSQPLSEVRTALELDDESENYSGYTATSVNEINNLFKKLKNPEIPIYVYPHLVHEGEEAQPVPGYSTAFYLYKNNQFAMPSENY